MRLLFFVLLLLTVAGRASSSLADSLLQADVLFIYVHGFAEMKEVVPFEGALRSALADKALNAQVYTFRYDSVHFDLSRVTYQWTCAKERAWEAGEELLNEVILPLEEAGTPYVLTSYSLGCRVVSRALALCPQELHQVLGVYFMGAAITCDSTLEQRCLPKGAWITNYYSPFFDEALKFSYYNAEGAHAGGEVGFSDEDLFQNYRTCCTHVHKGGPLQRDYSNLAQAILEQSLLRGGLQLPGERPGLNWRLPVFKGVMHWNDILAVSRDGGLLLVQQHVNTMHYRLVEIQPDGDRRRLGWCRSLGTLLEKYELEDAVSAWPGPDLKCTSAQ